ncbi:MAG: lactate utilization protein [Anaerolineae bacterium]|nr:lactate utilization protein [Anaerolineae bacterium]
MTLETRMARAAILARLRQSRPEFDEALSAPESPLPVTRLSAAELNDSEALLARFRAEVERLSVTFQHVPDSESALDALLAVARAQSAQSALLWQNLPIYGVQEALQSVGVQPIVPQVGDAARHDIYRAWNDVPLGISGVDAAFATTGTLVLATDSGQGRLPSLLPPTHVALLPRQKLFPRLEDWLLTYGAQTLMRSRSVVFITGPSRTGDIEMQIILGVHGPKRLHIIVFD